MPTNLKRERQKMALMSCPECSREISNKAEACPHCGFPVARMAKLQVTPEPILDVVCCLDCKKEFPFSDDVCPYCGLFNSQKYKETIESENVHPIPFIYVSEKEGYMSVKCPKCSKVSKIKSYLAYRTDNGYAVDGNGTCSCGQTFYQIKIENKHSIKGTVTCGCKWLYFWNYFSLPFGAIIGILMALGMAKYEKPIFALILFIISAYQFIVAFGLHKRNFWAWQWNWAYIALTYISMIIPYQVPGQILDDSALLVQAAGKLIVGAFLWVWPNYVYWRKRKHLFVES
jgi:double zinc ribbon protein